MRVTTHMMCAAIALCAAPRAMAQDVSVQSAPSVASQAPVTTLVQPEPRYGRRGQWVLGGTSQLSLAGGHNAHRSILSVLPKNLFNFSFSPSFAVFVARYVAVGLTGAVQVTRAPGITSWSLAVGPEGHGYIPLHERVGLFPGVSLLYRRIDSDDTLLMQFKVPVAIHLNRQVSLSVGPQVNQDVWRHRARLRATGYGLYVGLLGWL